MTTPRVAVLISGSGSNMVELVKSMQEERFATPVLVVANKPDAAGLAKAEGLGVPTAFVPSKGRDRAAFEAELVQVITSAEPDILCLAGFMRVLSAAFVNHWAGRILNIHPSLLPLFKGLDTHERAVAAGVAVHGCSVHLVTPDLDDGPILGQAVVPRLADDTADSLAARVLTMEHKLYPAVLKRYVEGETAPLALFP